MRSALAIVLLLSLSTTAQLKHSTGSQFKSYRGLLMAGYQGWFNTPDDGAGRGWYHYQSRGEFGPGNTKVDMWPETAELSKKYKTPRGRFSYRVMPSPYYSFGTISIELSPGQVAIIATPEKALCDKILTTAGLALRSTTQTLRFLLEDLRIDKESLRKLKLKELRSWIEDAPKKESLSMLVKTLEKL